MEDSEYVYLGFAILKLISNSTFSSQVKIFGLLAGS